jgi:hypothetical protein
VASAARQNSDDLLLRYLELTGWSVEIRDDGNGLSALAVHEAADGPLRIAAWARTRTALVIAVFEQACRRMSLGHPLES